MFPGNELGPSHNKLSHPGSWTDLRKAGKKNFLSTEDLWVSPSAARVALGQLWAQEGNCEWSFKAPDLGRSLDTWFPEMTVLEISRSWGWLCLEEEVCFWQSSWQAVAKDVQCKMNLHWWKEPLYLISLPVSLHLSIGTQSATARSFKRGLAFFCPFCPMPS